jgi:hypothetical protein
VIRLRRALAPFAAAWLLCQVTTLAIVPAMYGTVSSHTVALECTCGHGDHAMCPMHHQPADAASRCVMRSAGDGAADALISLFGPLGVPDVTTAALAPGPARTLLIFTRTHVSPRHTPPDPPPPRA